MASQSELEQARQEMKRRYKQFQNAADDLVRLFKIILEAPKYETLWPNVNRWIEWVNIARKMVDYAKINGTEIPNETILLNYIAIPVNITTTTGLDPEVFDKINGKVSEIQTMVNEIIMLFIELRQEENEGETE